MCSSFLFLSLAKISLAPQSSTFFFQDVILMSVHYFLVLYVTNAFSVAVVKPHNQDSLQKEAVVWACSSGGRSICGGGIVGMAAGAAT